MAKQSEDFTFLDGEFQIVDGSKVTKLLGEPLEQNRVTLVVELGLVLLSIYDPFKFFECLFASFEAEAWVLSNSVGIGHDLIEIDVDEDPHGGRNNECSPRNWK